MNIAGFEGKIELFSKKNEPAIGLQAAGSLRILKKGCDGAAVFPDLELLPATNQFDFCGFQGMVVMVLQALQILEVG